MPLGKNCSATAEVSIDAGQTAEPLACKPWADRAPQCAPGVLLRKIVGGDLRLSAVVPGSLLHDCYMMGASAAAAGPPQRGDRGNQVRSGFPPPAGHRNQKPRVRVVDHGALHVTGRVIVQPGPQRWPLRQGG